MTQHVLHRLHRRIKGNAIYFDGHLFVSVHIGIMFSALFWSFVLKKNPGIRKIEC